MRSRWYAPLLAVCSLAMACREGGAAPERGGITPGSEATPAPAPARPAPDVPAKQAATIAGFPGITGPELLSLAGKFERGALVNMWASWCGSCKKELPMLGEVEQAFGEHGIGLVLVSADQPEALPKARELLDGVNVHAEAYYLAGRVGAFKRSVYPRWLGAIPATFLIDSTGQVRYFWNGPVLADEISVIVQRFLAGDHIDGELDVAAKPVGP